MKKWKGLRRSEFLKNVATLASGTTLAQGISVLSAPILYRIYEKVDYGTLGLYMAFTGIIGVFSTMQYAQAILLEKQDEDAKQVIWLCRFINLGITCILAIIVLIGKSWISQQLNNPEMAPWLLMAPFSVFFAGQNSILRVWANRKKKYKVLTLNVVLSSLIVPLFSISLGIAIEGPLGLFIGLLISQIIPPIVMLITLSRSDQLGLSILKPDKVHELAKKYKNFPKFSLPSEFLHRFSNQLPVLVLSAFVGPAIVGVYNLSIRMLGLPVNLITSSVAEVFKQRAVEEFHQKGNCRVLFKNTFKGLIAVSLIPFLGLIIWGPDIFSIVFGEKWRDAGVFGQILSVYFLFRFFVRPLSFLLILQNKLQEDMLLQLLRLVLTFLGLYIGLQAFDNIYIALSLYSLAYSLIYVAYLLRSFQLSKGLKFAQS